MKIWIDTNIILDVLCNRKGFVEDSSRIWKMCEINRIEGYISALSVPNIVYILRKEIDPKKTMEIIQKLTLIFEVVDLRASDLKNAAAMLTSDYEDAIQMCQAARIHADHIVTRNIRDFKESSIQVSAPDELLAKI